MIINPIIPIWIMALICVFFLILKRKGTVNYIRQILIVVLLFVINLRIMIRGDEIPASTKNVDVLFVVDNTISMLAEDYDGNGRRLDAVKADCEYIIDQFPGASFSVVTFDSNVKAKIPYTIDTNMTIETINVLRSQEEFYATGTSLNDAMAFLKDYLDNERETYQIVFFISDGEITSSDALKSYKELEKFVDAGAVLGYGTSEGGAMKPPTYLDEEEYLYYYDDDFNRKKAISKIDEGNLKSIASDLGVEYVHMTKQNKIKNTITSINSKIATLESEDGLTGTVGYDDIYYYFVIALFVVLLVDYIYYKKKI